MKASMRNPTPQERNIYIELGAGGAAKSKLELEWIRNALRWRRLELIKIGRHQDADDVREVLRAGFNQSRTPYYTYITEQQRKALSRAFRVEAFSLVGDARMEAMMGKDNRDFSQWQNIYYRSKKVVIRKRTVNDLAAKRRGI